MKLTPEEAINAATINGAYAMGISENYGSITIGKKANLILTKKCKTSFFNVNKMSPGFIFMTQSASKRIQAKKRFRTSNDVVKRKRRLLFSKE